MVIVFIPLGRSFTCTPLVHVIFVTPIPIIRVRVVGNKSFRSASDPSAARRCSTWAHLFYYCSNVRFFFFFFALQPCDYRVLGASLRKGRLSVPQGPEEASGGQSKTTVRPRHLVPGLCRSIRECTPLVWDVLSSCIYTI